MKKKLFLLFLFICSFSFAEECKSPKEAKILGFSIQNAKNEEMESDVREMFREMIGVDAEKYKFVDFKNAVLKKYKDYKRVDFYPNVNCNTMTIDVILVEDNKDNNIPKSTIFVFFALLVMLFLMSNG